MTGTARFGQRQGILRMLGLLVASITLACGGGWAVAGQPPEVLDPIIHDPDGPDPTYDKYPEMDAPIITQPGQDAIWAAGGEHELQCIPPSDSDTKYVNCEPVGKGDHVTVWWGCSAGEFKIPDYGVGMYPFGHIGPQVTWVAPEKGDEVTFTCYADDNYYDYREVQYHYGPDPDDWRWVTREYHDYCIADDEQTWDEVEIRLIYVDLDINTDDHPRSPDGVPLVSRVIDITDDDDPKEMLPGGYLWVNDDNDHEIASDAQIDMGDVSDYQDNDLEPVTYDIPDVVWDSGYDVEVEINFPAGRIKMWQGNKSHELTSGVYSSLASLDFDQDGVLHLEGLDSGSGTVVLRVKDGADTLFEDIIEATTFKVVNVEWESYVDTGILTSVENDPGPAPTGQTRDGKRLFPDRTSPTDTVHRDRPRIITTITPPIPLGYGWHLPLHCKAFDVDHYAKDEFEGSRFDDPSSSYDPEGHNATYEPNDNRTGYEHNPANPGWEVSGNFGAANDAYNIGIEVLEAGDHVVSRTNGDIECSWWERLDPAISINSGTAILHITHHTPCNNWRVAASLAGCTGVRINNDPNDGVKLEYINNTTLGINAAETTPAKSTQTLTVWRKLYLEEDRMILVDFSEGPTDEQSIQHNDVNGGAGSAQLQTDLNAALGNQWQNGLAQFWDVSWPPTNDRYLGPGTVAGNGPGADVWVQFAADTPADTDYVYVTDDDVDLLAVYADLLGRQATGTPKVNPETDLTLLSDKDMLPAACILPDHTTLDAYDSTVTFDLHIQDDGTAFSKIAEGKGIRGGNRFWVATACACYQFNRLYSYDPDTVSAMGGGSAPYWNTDPPPPTPSDACGGFTTYVETCRDFALEAGAPFNYALVIRRATVHECGHVLGGRHEDGGIMAQLGITNGKSFNGVSLRRFMLLRDMGPGSP